MAGAQLGAAAASAIPGPAEIRLRRQVKADAARLARDGGGMTSSQRGALTAEAMGGVQAGRAQMGGELARGSAAGALSAGQRQSAISDLNRATFDATNQVGSAVRAQDLALGTQQRAENRQMQAALMEQGAARREALAAFGASQLAPSEAAIAGAGSTGQQTRYTVADRMTRALGKLKAKKATTAAQSYDSSLGGY
jgi:hypothetical protein